MNLSREELMDEWDEAEARSRHRVVCSVCAASTSEDEAANWVLNPPMCPYCATREQAA